MTKNGQSSLRLTALCAALLVLSTGTANADRDQTCTLRGGNHQAIYHCPEHYDAVVAGDGTDKCDGSCYESQNIQGLSVALSEIINSRFHTKLQVDSFRPLAQRLLEQGFVRIRTGEPLTDEATAWRFSADLTIRVRPDQPR
jgi:hypothetical protein